MNSTPIRVIGKLLAGVVLVASVPAPGQHPAPCEKCAAWNETQKPFQVYGNTYYVGVHGLSSILITSSQGHVLIDGDLEESVPKIVASIRSLGFRVEDIKLILNSHVHFDHSGGIAGLQRLSGATVAASESSAQVLQNGHLGPDDPQFGSVGRIPPVAQVTLVKDGETLSVGPLRLTAHLTPGHTPGGTSWTWKSCERDRCLNVVYADSLTSVSAPGFLFSRNSSYSTVLQDFEHSFKVVEALLCDILLTPHPEMSDLWSRLARHDAGAGVDAFVDTDACRRLVETSRQELQARLATEPRA